MICHLKLSKLGSFERVYDIVVEIEGNYNSYEIKKMIEEYTDIYMIIFKEITKSLMWIKGEKSLHPFDVTNIIEEILTGFEVAYDSESEMEFIDSSDLKFHGQGFEWQAYDFAINMLIVKGIIKPVNYKIVELIDVEV
jgi:hypothetical protein